MALFWEPKTIQSLSLNAMDKLIDALVQSPGSTWFNQWRAGVFQGLGSAHVTWKGMANWGDYLLMLDAQLWSWRSGLLLMPCPRWDINQLLEKLKNMVSYDPAVSQSFEPACFWSRIGEVVVISDLILSHQRRDTGMFQQHRGTCF